MTDEEQLQLYKDKIATTGSMTAHAWDHYDRLFKRLDPEGYIIQKEYSRIRYLTKMASELSTEDLQAIIDSRK